MRTDFLVETNVIERISRFEVRFDMHHNYDKFGHYERKKYANNTNSVNIMPAEDLKKRQTS